MRDKSHRNENVSESGQSLIIIALLMVGMIAALGLALDGGNAVGTRRKSQNAADAGAFAGARMLATQGAAPDQTAVYNAIVNLARSNGIASAADVTAWFIDENANNICVMPCVGGVPGNATGVRVNARMQLQPYFIDIFMGKNKIPLPAQAAAQSGNPAPSTLMPMVVPCNQLEHPECDYGYGTMVTIKGDQQGNGSVQWLDYGGCTLDGYLRLECTSGTVTPDEDDTYWDPLDQTKWNSGGPFLPSNINPWRKTKTGEVAAVAKALNCWLEPSGPQCWESIPYPGNRLWLVPITNHNNGDESGNNLWYHIYAVGEFEFYGYYFANGSCNWIGKGKHDNCSSDLPATLRSCADANIKCLQGKFLQLADVPIRPERCVPSGTNVCGIGMSE